MTRDPNRARAVYANKRRVALLRKLSPRGRCAACGAYVAIGRLRIQYVEGAKKKPAKGGRWDRVAQYERDHAAGVELRAICHGCTGRVGAAHARART